MRRSPGCACTAIRPGVTCTDAWCRCSSRPVTESWRRTCLVSARATSRPTLPSTPSAGTDRCCWNWSRHWTFAAVNLVVQDWGGLLGLTLPMAAPARYRGLLVMNTCLATADEPLPEGFLHWRTMCRDKPDFSISRLFARSNPQMNDVECGAYDAPFPSLAYRAATRAFPEGCLRPRRRWRGRVARGGGVLGARVGGPRDDGSRGKGPGVHTHVHGATTSGHPRLPTADADRRRRPLRAGARRGDRRRSAAHADLT